MEDNVHVIPMAITREVARDFEIADQVSLTRTCGITQLAHFVKCSSDVYTGYMRLVWREDKAQERQNRCNVSNKNGKLIRCPDTNDCNNCPYGYSPEDRNSSSVSLNSIIDKGMDFASSTSVEADVLIKIQKEESIKLLLAVEEDGDMLATIFIHLCHEETRESIAMMIGKSTTYVTEKVGIIRTLLYEIWH